MSHTHPHPHSHPESAPEPAAHAPLPPPSHEGSVVLDIGGDIGALIIHTGPEQDGLEIEVSPLGEDQQRTHAAVRPRELVDRTVYCALITPLTAGGYTVWRDPDTAAGTVSVPAGGVGEHHWA